MARIRTIQHDDALDTVWEELVYTEARLSEDALAADLAPVFQELLAQLETARHGQREAWRREVVAQARVDAANAALDASTTRLGVRLLAAVEGQRESPRWRRYFKEGPSDVVKLALGRQVERVRGWPASLAAEPEESVRALAAELTARIGAGDAALRSRAEAAAARADQRVREVLTLVDDVNAARMRTMGSLLQRAAERGLPRDWAESFFRRAHRVVGGGAAGGDGGGGGGEGGGA